METIIQLHRVRGVQNVATHHATITQGDIQSSDELIEQVKKSFPKGTIDINQLGQNLWEITSPL